MLRHRFLDALLALSTVTDVEALAGLFLDAVLAVHDQKGIESSMSSNPLPPPSCADGAADE